MKRILFICLIFYCTVSVGQAPEWSWVKSSGGTKISNTIDGYGNEAYAMAADAFGNVYVAGYFLSATIIFDDDTLENNSSDNDVFIVKYDNDGNVLWARSVGGSGNDCPNSVTTDPYGNIIVAGFFKSPEIVFGNDTMSNSGYTDLFILKFDTDGNPLWARAAEGTAEDIAMSVSADNSGNIYLTGYSQSPMIIFGSDTLITNSSADAFIVKYTPDGNVIRTNIYGGTMEDRGNAIAADIYGNVYTCGAFKGSYIIFGTDTLFNNSVSGYSDMYLIKFDSTGGVLWAKEAGASSDERLYALAVDNSGDIYATGVFFSSTFSLGSTTLTNSIVNKADIFISKWNSAGQVQWLKGAGGSKDDQSLSIAADANGYLAVAICYNSPYIKISQDTLFDSGLYNGAVAYYNPNGDLQWTKNIGGNRDDGAFAAAINTFGNVFSCGYFQSHYVPFDTIMLTSQDTDYSTVYVGSIQDIFTGEMTYSVEPSCRIFPNPSNGEFVIETNNNDKTILKIYSISGLEIYSESLLSDIEKINLQGIAKGIYLLKIQDSRNTEILKLIVE